jgi:hypothetical protein
MGGELMKKFFNGRPERVVFYSGLLLVLLLLLVGTGVVLFGGSGNVLATVGSEKITKTQYEETLKKYYKDPASATAEEKKTVFSKMVEESIVRQEAKKLEIADPSETEIVTYLNNRGRFSGNAEEFKTIPAEDKTNLENVARVSILKDKITDKVVTAKTGNIAVARFDRSLEYSGIPADQLEKDKTYAKSKIDAYLAELKAGTKTIKQVMEALDNDPVIGKPAWNNANNYVFSFSLTNAEFTERGQLSGSANLWDSIDKQGKGLSEVILCKDKKPEGEKQELKAMDAFYAIISVDTEKGGSATYEEWLKAKMSEYKVDVNKINLG